MEARGFGENAGEGDLILQMKNTSELTPAYSACAGPIHAHTQWRAQGGSQL